MKVEMNGKNPENEDIKKTDMQPLHMQIKIKKRQLQVWKTSFYRLRK